MIFNAPRQRHILAFAALALCLPWAAHAQQFTPPYATGNQSPAQAAARQRAVQRASRRNNGQNGAGANANNRQNPNNGRRRTGRTTPTRTPIDLVPGETVSSAPVFGKNGLLYLASWNSRVYALDAATGTLKWKFTAPKMFNSSPALGPDGTVYAGSYDGKLYALDGKAGTKKWQFPTRALLNETPAVSPSGDMVYVGGYDRSVYAVGTEKGTLKWRTPVGAAVSSPAVGSDGTIYVGADKIYALKPADGTAKWQFLTGFDAASPVALSGGGVIYAQMQDSSGGSQICALDTASGKKLWVFPLLDNITAPAIAASDRVYVGSDYLYSLRQSSGHLVWRHGDGTSRWSTPTIDNSIVCAGNDSGSVDALDAATGATLWTFATNDPLISFPRFGPGGIVYVSCEVSRKTYALAGRTGKVLWQFTQDPLPTAAPAPRRTTR